MVDAPDQPSEGDLIHDVVDALIGLLGVGNIVYGEEDSCRALNKRQEERGASQREEPIDLGDFAVQDNLIDAFEPQAFVQPGEPSSSHVRPP